ncbi:MAG: hypothetical protein A2029_15490 [Chloroflexi bacterium RBG_19FT_COMBO_47_9]|nr:MAG: hypothetical protein A2029_15490 [Chloroflexi bacterium RBG_19FT_COMBO_47_9]
MPVGWAEVKATLRGWGFNGQFLSVRAWTDKARGTATGLSSFSGNARWHVGFLLPFISQEGDIL